MSKTKHPASGDTLDGAGGVDLAGKRVGLPYCAENQTRKGPSLLFRQLTSMALNPPVRGFEHAYGDRPPGNGWWSPAEGGPDHHVRSVRRRRRP